MAVYVDTMRARVGRLVMCHMIADSSEELHAMADRIGVARKWLQHPGTPREHFDICLAKRSKAVKAGAIEVTQRELAARCMARAIVPPRSPWRSMDSAPTDGTLINVWLGDADQDDAAFYCVPGTRFSAGWSYVNGKFRPIGGLPGIPVQVQPTAWMPVPGGPQ